MSRIAIALLILLSGCSRNLWIDREPNIDFSAYKTFTWNTVTEGVGHEYYFHQEIDAELKPAINSLLAEQGLRLVSDTEAADLFVDYHYYVRENYFEQTYCPAGYYGGSGFTTQINPGPRCEVEEKVLTFDSGDFAMDLVDVKTGQLVWRGHSFEVVENPRFTAEILSRKVKKMLRRYPGRVAMNLAGAAK